MNPNAVKNHDRKTIKETVAHYKEMLAANPDWALKGLLVIYGKQTASEQASAMTQVDNGVGFTGVDAEILTSFAQQFQRKRYLTPRQMRWLHRKMPKYARQLYNIAHGRV